MDPELGDLQLRLVVEKLCLVVVVDRLVGDGGLNELDDVEEEGDDASALRESRSLPGN